MLSTIHILIVDDHPTNRKLLSASLAAEGHHVLEALDGAAALTILEHSRVDAIVSDVLMPNMDGFELCLAVRADPRLRALPFIVYTSAYDSAAGRDVAARVRADDYLTKPAPVSAILRAIGAAATRPGPYRPELAGQGMES